MFWLVVSTDFRQIFDQNQTWFRPIFSADLQIGRKTKLSKTIDDFRPVYMQL